MAKTLIVAFLFSAAVASTVSESTTIPPPTTNATTTTTIPTEPPSATNATTTTTIPTEPPSATNATTTTTIPTEPPSATNATTPASASTGTQPTEGPSVSPNTGSSQTNAPSTAPVTPTPKPPGPCASNPCRGGSTCQERFDQTFVCVCLTGDYYQGACQRGNIFLKELFLGIPYDVKMADKTSQEFKDTAKIITDVIDKQFKGQGNGYIGASVLELREQQSKARAQRQQGNVEASVEIIYELTAGITQDTVTETMNRVICKGCPLDGTFVVKSLCESNPCDASTSTCQPEGVSFKCRCKDGYKETDYSERLCQACPSGEKVVDNKCVKCSFGYNGFNCNDDTLLIVVIVCSIVGALLIAVLIALPFVAKKPNKKSSKRKVEDIGQPYQSHSVAKAPLSYSHGNSNDFSASVKEPTNSLATSGAPRIPRATTNSNWESRANLEMTPSNSRQNLIPSGMNSRFNDNQDDMYSFPQNRQKNHPYEEIQPKSNPYTQNRASNPYAQTRGQTNPLYS